MSAKKENKVEVGLLGRKLGMTQVFAEDGSMVPVTVMETGPCKITQIKTEESDGYNAIQLGFGEAREKSFCKSAMGHLRKSSAKPLRFLRELRQTPDSLQNYELGQEIKCDIFKEGDVLDITATSVGKGFQGVMKRYNMRGGKASHGVHEVYRHGGSLGCRFPQHVVKGKKMAGHMGNRRVTIQNQSVAQVRAQENLILLKGTVPGKKNTWVLLRKAVKHAEPVAAK